MTTPENIGQCPWVGPLPCEEWDGIRFNGRNKELTEIFPKVRTQPLTVISADTGAGKTSLIGAGLIPALRLGRDRDPNTIGFTLCVRKWGSIISKSGSSSFLKDPARVMIDTIGNSLNDLCEAASKHRRNLLGIDRLLIDLENLSTVQSTTGGSESEDIDIENLKIYVSNLRDAVKGGKLIIIVDQAEEFMGSGLYTSPLHRHTGALDVLETLAQMKDVRLVISLREEYLGKLRLLEQRLYPLAPCIYHLNPLTWGGSREAIYSTANGDTDVEIEYLEINRVLEWVSFPHHVSGNQRDLLPIDMLSVQAFLLDLYNRENIIDKEKRLHPSSYKRLKINKDYLDKYEENLLNEEPRLNEQESHKAIVPMLRWIDSAFDKLDAENGNLIRRIASNMGTVLSTPKGFKSHITRGDLIYHAIRKDLPMSAKLEMKINDVRRILASGEKLKNPPFPPLAVEMSDAGFKAIEYLIDGNILKSYGSDEHGNPIYSLQHDGYGPALTEWCEDPRRRENDVLTSRVGVYGFQIRRYTDIQNTNLKEVIWEGCDIRGISSNNVTFENCKFTGSYFEDCVFNNCEFKDCKFDGTVFIGGKFKDVKFSNSAARGLVVKGMEWQNVVLHDCDLTSAVTQSITLDGNLRIEACTVLYAQIYRFKTKVTGNAPDITATGCNLHGALFEDYNERDSTHFCNCSNVTIYTTQAPKK